MSERPYKGPIEVGGCFIWEPDVHAAFERIVVTAVTEYAVQSEGRLGTHWNDEGRFREAVVLDGGAE